MEEIRRKIKNITLKKYLAIVFMCFIISIAILISLTVMGCMKVQKIILNSRSIYIQAEDLEQQEDGSFINKKGDDYEWSPLTAKQKIIYYGSIVAMIVFPVLYVVIGVMLTSAFYYRRKLEKPLHFLRDGIHRIRAGDLDFELSYSCADELGRLCEAVEMTRQELKQNKKQIWGLLEDRKALNASISHDLGTPLTIIKGYIEYLQKDVPKNHVPPHVLLHTLSYMSEAVKRLESYIHCVRDVQRLDEIEIHVQPVQMNEILQELKSGFRWISEKNQIEIMIDSTVDDMVLSLDKQVFFRMIENIIDNAYRYAKSEVKIELKLKDDFLWVNVLDDGNGFTEEMLKAADSLFSTTHESSRNMGLGLYICKILCKKHEGNLVLSNGANGGGNVQFSLRMKDREKVD